jgi:predicted N-acetyltransferase YhbS
MAPINCTIRPATPEDAKALTAITFRSKASWGYPESWINQWRDELTVTPKMLNEWLSFVAELKGQIVGFWSRSAIQTDEVSPGFLFIDPDHFGKGVAMKLWHEMKSALINEGVRHFTVEADPNAVAFYEKIGGIVIGEKDSLTIKGRKLPLIKIQLSES